MVDNKHYRNILLCISKYQAYGATDLMIEVNYDTNWNRCYPNNFKTFQGRRLGDFTPAKLKICTWSQSGFQDN